MGPDTWDWRPRVDGTSTFPTLKYAVPHLKQQGGPVVVTSSVSGTRTFSNIGATADVRATAGQVALAQMVALELVRDRVRVSLI